MEKIQFDSGLRSYKLGQGVLRFNPADPNVYARFMEAADKLRSVEQELVSGDWREKGGDVVQVLLEADRKMKDILGWVFGPGNDFDAMLSGVNLLAVAENGQRVATNLLSALEPVLIAGAKVCAAGRAAEALNKAKKRRESQ